MSHSPERKENDCLNCGAIVHGRYCHVCGQENKVPRENFWDLVIHFFYDITHFDSKFFDTIKYLLGKPGFLPQEYIKGRRVSYLNPIRMYIFTSAFFFLIFFAFFAPSDDLLSGTDIKISPETRDSLLTSIDKKIEEEGTKTNRAQMKILLEDTTAEIHPNDLIKYSDDFTVVNLGGGKYKSLKEYDSIQSQLPANKKDGWLKRTWNKKELEINEKFKKDPSSSTQKLVDGFLHKLPYLLFISLPFFALILKLLYVRRNWYYADHIIFSVYHYIFSFLLLLFVFGFDALNDFTGWKIFNILMVLSFFAWRFYLYKSMRRFYKQRRAKTIIKFLLLNMLGFFCILFLLIFFVLFSIFQF